MNFFDAHTHVQFAAFAEDYKEVIRRALDAGVGLINVGTQKDTSLRAIEIAHEYENDPVFAAVGLHPIHTEKSYHDAKELGLSFEALAPGLRSQNRFGGVGKEGTTTKEFTSRGEEFDFGYYKKLASDPRVVAIGECGLDYYRLGEETKDRQKEAFLAQVELSREVKKPLMIHCRNAFADLVDTLQSSRFKLHDVPGVIHFFSGTKEDAKSLLELGFSFTFGGVVTFARDYDEVIKMIPLDRILSETDAPYVTPAPHRGKRNEPVYVIEVVRKLAELKGVATEEMASRILENTRNIFYV